MPCCAFAWPRKPRQYRYTGTGQEETASRARAVVLAEPGIDHNPLRAIKRPLQTEAALSLAVLCDGRLVQAG
jgi:hypothetical protein